jgi:hypothetical protein
MSLTFTTPPPDEAALRALWAWLRPPGCRLTLAEALRHSQYSIVIKCAAKRGRHERRREVARQRITTPAQPDLFTEPTA